MIRWFSLLLSYAGLIAFSNIASGWLSLFYGYFFILEQSNQALPDGTLRIFIISGSVSTGITLISTGLASRIGIPAIARSIRDLNHWHFQTRGRFKRLPPDQIRRVLSCLDALPKQLSLLAGICAFGTLTTILIYVYSLTQSLHLAGIILIAGLEATSIFAMLSFFLAEFITRNNRSLLRARVFKLGQSMDVKHLPTSQFYYWMPFLLYGMTISTLGMIHLEHSRTPISALGMILTALIAALLLTGSFAFGAVSSLRRIRSKSDTFTEASQSLEMPGFLVREILEAELALNKASHDVQDMREGLENSRHKAETADRAKSIFLAMVSHELRTPLNAVIGMSDLLATTEQNKQNKVYIDAIQNGGQTLLSLIGDILDISGLQSGKMNLNPEDVEIGQQCSDLILLFEHKFREQKIQFKVHISKKIPLYLHVDIIRFKQILSNLLGNALKFTSGGFVRIGFYSRIIDEDTCRIGVVVRDSGIGISSEGIARIFEPFYQADSSISRQYGGTGLGLAISKQLVNLMDSNLKIRSRKGDGTVFFFRLDLPYSNRQTEQNKTQPNSDASGLKGLPDHMDLKGSLKLLVAEDNEINLKVMVKILDIFGYEVDLARNGLEAIQATQSKSYDLIFMDLEMPEMDGFSAATEIIKSNDMRPAPVIIPLTAHNTREIRDRCLEIGMIGFLSKPINLKIIGQTLAVWENRLLIES